MADPIREWLYRARSALHLACLDLDSEGIALEDRCYQLQQCAAKALKAVLLYHGVEPPRTHNLTIVVGELEGRIRLPDWKLEVNRLNNYAVSTRYPGDYEPITQDEFERARELAALALAWAESVVAGKGEES